MKRRRLFVCIGTALLVMLFAAPALATASAQNDDQILQPDEITKIYIAEKGAVAYSEKTADPAYQLNEYGIMWEGRSIDVVEYGDEWCKVKFDKVFFNSDGNMVYLDTIAYIETKYLRKARELPDIIEDDDDDPPVCICPTGYCEIADKCVPDCPIPECINNAAPPAP